MSNNCFAGPKVERISIRFKFSATSQLRQTPITTTSRLSHLTLKSFIFPHFIEAFSFCSAAFQFHKFPQKRKVLK
jgi:hypothetical protein